MKDAFLSKYSTLGLLLLLECAIVKAMLYIYIYTHTLMYVCIYTQLWRVSTSGYENPIAEAQTYAMAQPSLNRAWPHFHFPAPPRSLATATGDLGDARADERSLQLLDSGSSPRSGLSS